MRETRLQIVQEGASAEELRRGIEAAEALFESAGVTPWQAAHAAWKVESAADGAEPPTEHEVALAALWDHAASVATEACCAGWAVKPALVRLRLVDLLEERVVAALASLYPDSDDLREHYDITAEIVGQSLAAMVGRGVPDAVAVQSIVFVVTNLLVEWAGPEGASLLLRHMAEKVDAEQLH